MKTSTLLLRCTKLMKNCTRISGNWTQKTDRQKRDLVTDSKDEMMKKIDKWATIGKEFKGQLRMVACG